MSQSDRKWNEAYGLDKDPIRMYLLFPKLFKKGRQLEGKKILDIGCGNGSLENQLLKHNPAEIKAVDISDEFLGFARENIKSEKVEFLKGDVREKFPFDEDYFDRAYCVFVIQELDRIDTTIKEISRTLKKGGNFTLVLNHPTYTLSLYLQEKYTGKKNRKMIGLKGYFDDFSVDYVLTIAKEKRKFYHRSLDYYISMLIKYGFRISRFEEFSVNQEIAERHPRYLADKDVPRFIIIESEKLRR